MIREATHDDIPAICTMGERFWALNPWNAAGPFSAEKTAQGLEAFLGSDDFTVMVIDRGGVVSGMICVVIVDVWTVEGGQYAQEMFWWVEPDASAESRALWKAAEDWVAARCVKLMSMGRLHGHRDDVIDRVYRGRGYQPAEHIYLRELV